MNLKDIEKLIKIVEESGLTKLSVEEDGIKLELVKDCAAPVVYQQPVVQQQVVAPVAPVALAPLDAPTAVDASGDDFFESPMVGTYYAAPSPEDPDFIKVGDKVKKGHPLCVIEAMKLFNEIESEFNGTIVEILVNNQDAIEFGQPLFKIKKDA